MDLDYRLVGLLVVGITALFMFFYQIRDFSLQWIGKAMLQTMMGTFLLFFLNLFGAILHFHIPLNLITVPVAGFLGIPGVLALVFVKVFII